MSTTNSRRKLKAFQHHHGGHLGLLMIIILMTVTLYLAFAFPYSLFAHLKQTETSQLRAVIVVARHGELTPASEAYFLTEQEDELSSTRDSPRGAEEEVNGEQQQQLTRTGRERMYLLGKFLKLQYYERLLGGNARRVSLWSEPTDWSLESAQTLLAGLNPPRYASKAWPSDDQLASLWQPRAIFSDNDALLSISEMHHHQQPTYPGQRRDGRHNCSRQLTAATMAWRRSTKYAQLVNEFRHDLQILRANTGLQFEDDLEMLVEIESAIRARKAHMDGMGAQAASGLPLPSWYTGTYAARLAHIAARATGCRFSSLKVQRLLVGRLLHEIVAGVKTGMVTAGGSYKGKVKSELLSRDSEDNTNTIQTPVHGPNTKGTGGERGRRGEPSSVNARVSASNKQRAMVAKSAAPESNMFVYMTNERHMSALLSALKIYSTQLNYGALLLIELHFDPTNEVHFLRFFTVNSPSHNVLPEPVRVNPPGACLGVPQQVWECSPQHFERNINHLTLTSEALDELCANNRDDDDGDESKQVTTASGESGAFSVSNTEQLPSDLPSTSIKPSEIASESTAATVGATDETTTPGDGPQAADGAYNNATSAPPATTPLAVVLQETTTTVSKQPAESEEEQNLIVDPIEPQTTGSLEATTASGSQPTGGDSDNNSTGTTLTISKREETPSGKTRDIYYPNDW